MKQPLRYLILFSLIILCAFFLRIFKVDTAPHDLYVDEVAIGYNAYSVLKTGHDEFGKYLPLIFRSFDDYKLPGYIYLTVLSEALFGKNAFAVRLPSVFFGVVSIGVCILLIECISKRKKIALLSGIFLAISPWHLQFTRAGFEASVALFFLMLGTLFLLKGVNNKRISQFFLGIFLYIAALYTYHSPRVFVPLFCIGFFILYREKIMPLFKQKKSYLFIGICFLIFIPFSLYSFSKEGMARAQSQSFLNEVRIGNDNLFSNKIFLSGETFLKNYVRYFSIDYLFFLGDQQARHSVREIGMNYIWQLPLFLIGIFVLYKTYHKNHALLLLWFFISPIAAALAVPNPHALRSLSVVIPVTYIISLGVFSFSRAPLARLVVTVCCVYFFISYLHIYYVSYPKTTSPDWSGGYKDTIEYITSVQNKYDKIYITKSLFLGYEYLYFYGNFDPKKVYLNLTRKKGIGKYIFMDGPSTQTKEKILYVSPPYEQWGRHLVKSITNHGNDRVFSIWEN